MRPMVFLSCCMVVLLGTLAWADEWPRTFRDATISASCAPWDGAALELLLLPKPKTTYPQMRIGIWRTDPPLKTWIFLNDMTSQTGVSTWCQSNAQCTLAPVEIWFDRLTHGGDAQGKWRYRDDKTHTQTKPKPFYARFVPVNVICG